LLKHIETDTAPINNIISTTNPSTKKWYEKPLGIVFLMVIAGLILWLLTGCFL